MICKFNIYDFANDFHGILRGRAMPGRASESIRDKERSANKQKVFASIE